LKQQQHLYHQIYHHCIRLGTNLKKILIPTNQKEVVMKKLKSLPPQEKAEEEEVGKDAKANDAEAGNARADGEQHLPVGEGKEEAADKHPLPMKEKNLGPIRQPGNYLSEE
jgi:hypothetical protein